MSREQNPLNQEQSHRPIEQKLSKEKIDVLIAEEVRTKVDRWQFDEYRHGMRFNGPLKRPDNMADFGVKINSRYVAGASISIVKNLESGTTYGLLHNLSVHPDYQGGGIAKKLTEARIAWAKEQGLTEVRTKVEYTNIPSLLSKLRMGFTIASIDSDYQTPLFHLSKKIEEKPVATDVSACEYLDIQLNRMVEIIKKINDGWVGYDLTPKHQKIIEKPRPSGWILKMRKPIENNAEPSI